MGMGARAGLPSGMGVKEGPDLLVVVAVVAGGGGCAMKRVERWGTHASLP